MIHFSSSWLWKVGELRNRECLRTCTGTYDVRDSTFLTDYGRTKDYLFFFSSFGIMNYHDCIMIDRENLSIILSATSAFKFHDDGLNW